MSAFGKVDMTTASQQDSRLTKFRPCIHQFTAPIQRVASPVLAEALDRLAQGWHRNDQRH